MAKKPDGKAARTERVTFTRPAADRIAKVVRIVEAGDRDGAGLYFGVRQTGKTDKQVRMATFTGAWSIGSQKTVTYKYQSSTPNTVNATNLFWPLNDDNPEPRDCSIGRDGTAWFLLVPQLFRANFFTAAEATQCGIKFDTLPGVALASSSTNTVFMQVQTVPVVTAASVTTSGITLERLSVGVLCTSSATSISLPFATNTVQVVTSVTMTDTALKFTRRTVRVFSDSTASDVEVSITTCATATAS